MNIDRYRQRDMNRLRQTNMNRLRYIYLTLELVSVAVQKYMNQQKYFCCGNYPINTIRNVVGLYRDDGLMIIKSKSNRVNNKHHKDIEVFFKQYRLRREVESNIIEVNYLDVNLNIFTGEYKPYRKPGNFSTIHKH